MTNVIHPDVPEHRRRRFSATPNDAGFACPACSNRRVRCIDTRPLNDYTSIRRRRICFDCGHRFTTHEVIVDEFEAKMAAADRLQKAVSKALEDFRQATAAAPLDQSAVLP